MGSQSVPAPGSFDKSTVFDIKPIRCLVPRFPPPSTISSFPSGFSPFYPFPALDSLNLTPPSNIAVPSPVPVSTFRAPTPHTANGGSSTYNQVDGEASGRKGRKRGSSEKRTKSNRDPNTVSQDAEMETLANNLLASFTHVGTEEFRAEGTKESIGLIVATFDLLRRKMTQIEEAKEASSAATKRHDLRAGTILMNKGVRTNVIKRVGDVPGTEIGDIFFFRFELCLVGLHSQLMSGIDYINVRASQDEDPLAVSIIASGSNDDNDDDGDVLIYSGQGGVYRKDKSAMDQKLEKGNLALEKSLHRGNEVRVIRGVKDFANPTGKVYIYDGLYKVQESWIEKGKSNCNVFKYKLFRSPGQPHALKMWQSIRHWKENIALRSGLILPDITSGSETLPVCLVNEVDNERGFPYFTYLPTLKYQRPVSSLPPSTICACQGGCKPGDVNCPCNQRNGGFPAYTSIGVLLNYNCLVYECGPSCSCPLNCRNRISQAGLKVRLEVFKTKDKGWGLRSWDPIRAGAFVCEYSGEAIGRDNGDDYIFDATRNYESLKFIPGYANETPKLPFPLVISAKNSGNVSRFMNHSCEPNLYWQPVVRDSDHGTYLHIAFFAICHIPPLKELTFDYGLIQPGKVEQWRKKCLCGSSKCRGHYY